MCFLRYDKNAYTSATDAGIFSSIHFKSSSWKVNTIYESEKTHNRRFILMSKLGQKHHLITWLKGLVWEVWLHIPCPMSPHSFPEHSPMNCCVDTRTAVTQNNCLPQNVLTAFVFGSERLAAEVSLAPLIFIPSETNTSSFRAGRTHTHSWYYHIADITYHHAPATVVYTQV